jgi:hypothetical protein
MLCGWRLSLFLAAVAGPLILVSPLAIFLGFMTNTEKTSTAFYRDVRFQDIQALTANAKASIFHFTLNQDSRRNRTRQAG